MKPRRLSMLNETSRAALRDAWSGPLTADEVGTEFRLCGKTVRRFWIEEKRAGRLPAIAARPFFADLTTAPMMAIETSAAASEDAEIDDEAADARPGCRVPPGDPLLAALRREHGADPFLKFQDMPNHTLLMEGPSGFMPHEHLRRIAEGMAPNTDKPPSRSRLLQFVRVKDSYTRALGRIFEGKSHHGQ